MIELETRFDELDAAEQICRELILEADPLATSASTELQCAVARLALTRGDAQRALSILEAVGADGGTPAVDGLFVEALFSAERLPEAERVAREALGQAEARGYRAQLWRLHGLLARILMVSGRRAEGELRAAAPRPYRC
jgi:hypothetical protein